MGAHVHGFEAQVGQESSMRESAQVFASCASPTRTKQMDEEDGRTQAFLAVRWRGSDNYKRKVSRAGGYFAAQPRM